MSGSFSGIGLAFCVCHAFLARPCLLVLGYALVFYEFSVDGRFEVRVPPSLK